MDVLAKGQFFRHEADFDYGADSVAQKSVIDLVYIRKVVERMALIVFVINADFVVQDVVKADVVEVSGLLYLAQVVSIALPQRKDGAAGTEGVLPEMWEGLGRGCGVDQDGFVLRLSCGSQGKQKRHNNCCEILGIHEFSCSHVCFRSKA